MIAAIVSWIVVVLLLATSTALFFSDNWRWSLGALASQYVGVFWLVAQHWPVGMAAAKLVAGWMATASLAMTLMGEPTKEEPAQSLWPQGRAFRFFMIGMVVILTVSVTPRLESSVPGLGYPVIAGGILLVGMGLLHLGTTSQLLRVILGLLTVLAGFEILYAAVEGSILVAALLVVINLALGLVGAYLLNAMTPEESA